jgi:hypothetical protein
VSPGQPGLHRETLSQKTKKKKKKKKRIHLTTLFSRGLDTVYGGGAMNTKWLRIVRWRNLPFLLLDMKVKPVEESLPILSLASAWAISYN